MSNALLKIRNVGNDDWLAILGSATPLLDSSAHTDTVTGAPVAGDLIVANATPKWARLGAGSQYQVLGMGAALPAWSGFLLDGTTGGKTVLAVTNTKTLTLTAADSYNLTVPATGTAALLGTSNVFTAEQTITIAATNDLVEALLVEPTVTINDTSGYAISALGFSARVDLNANNPSALLRGVHGQAIAQGGAFTQDIAYGGDFNVRATGSATITDARAIYISTSLGMSGAITTAHAIYIDTLAGSAKYAIYNNNTDAPIYTKGDIEITNTAPLLTLTDTTASAKSLKLTVDANLAKFEEVGGAANNLLVLDLANARVGIGQAASSSELHVAGAGFADVYNGQIIVASNQAYNASPVAGIHFWNKYTSGGAYAGMGGISVGKENTTDSNLAGYLAFYTRPAGGAITEYARIKSSGEFGIGTASPTAPLYVAGADSGTQQLRLGHSNGSSYWGLGRDNVTTGDLIITSGASEKVRIASGGNTSIGTTTTTYKLNMDNGAGALGGYYDTADDAWHNGSSIRWKENVRVINDAIAILKRLRGVRFDWKEKGLAGVGFIAEEVGSVLPESVGWSKDNPGYADGYNPAGIIGVLVEAVKELEARVSALGG